MKKSMYTFTVVCLVAIVASCGILNKGTSNPLYNKHNREKVKVKDGLFSSKKASFGPYATSSIEDGVNKRIISFSKRQDPFHFAVSKEESSIVKVQAVYTNRTSLKNKALPNSFYQSDISKIFYAWISSSSVNNLNNWELIVKSPSYGEIAKNAVVGVLQSSQEKIDVHANNRSGNVQSYDELTYEFQLRGIPIAAVQVNGKHQYVWIQPSLKKDVKNAIVGAMAALLLR